MCHQPACWCLWKHIYMQQLTARQRVLTSDLSSPFPGVSWCRWGGFQPPPWWWGWWYPFFFGSGSIHLGTFFLWNYKSPWLSDSLGECFYALNRPNQYSLRSCHVTSMRVFAEPKNKTKKTRQEREGSGAGATLEYGLPFFCWAKVLADHWPTFHWLSKVLVTPVCNCTCEVDYRELSAPADVIWRPSRETQCATLLLQCNMQQKVEFIHSWFYSTLSLTSFHQLPKESTFSPRAIQRRMRTAGKSSKLRSSRWWPTAPSASLRRWMSWKPQWGGWRFLRLWWVLIDDQQHRNPLLHLLIQPQSVSICRFFSYLSADVL